MKHKPWWTALSVLCGLCAFACMTCSVIYSAVVSEELMYSGFVSCANTAHLGVDAGQYDDYARLITRYLKGQTDVLQITDDTGSRDAFSEKENLHMQDVRGLIRLLRLIRVSAGALALFGAFALFVHARKGGDGTALLKGAAAGACLWLVCGAVLTALALSGFESFFIGFHRLFFRNDLWLLNPQTDLLIALMPTTFFIWYGGELLKRLLPVAALGVVTVLAAIFLSRLSQKESKPQ